MIIDCDVHHARKKKEDIVPYLREPWKTEFLTYGERPIGSGALNEGRYRWDAVPPGGGPPGSDPEFMKQQLLDKYDMKYAILTAGFHLTAIPDPEYSAAFASALNDFTIDKWLPTDSRFKGTITISQLDPLLAAREIERLADHPDMVGIMMSSTTKIPFGNHHYYPIYEAATRHNLPIAVHTGPVETMYAQAAPTAAGTPRNYLEWHSCVPQVFMAHLASLILGGAFEKFPTLRFAFIEGGFDWVPHMMWRMDGRYKGLRQQAPWLKRLPSEYIADHFRFTTQPWFDPKHEDYSLQIFEMMDAENILMYSSDYPHWDFDEPTVLPKKLSETARRKILHDNAAEFFNL